MPSLPWELDGRDQRGIGNPAVSPLQCGRDVSDWTGTETGGRDRSAVHQPGLQLPGPDVRAPPGLLEDGPLRHSGAEPAIAVKDGRWLADGRHASEMNKTFYQIIDALDVNYKNTYVTNGFGERVPGVSPVAILKMVDRRIVMTKSGNSMCMVCSGCHYNSWR